MGRGSKRTMTHCCVDLDGLLKITLEKGSTELLEHDNGRPLTETEVYQLVTEEKAKGYKYYCPCDNRDSEGRCLGHPVLED